MCFLFTHRVSRLRGGVALCLAPTCSFNEDTTGAALQTGKSCGGWSAITPPSPLFFSKESKSFSPMVLLNILLPYYTYVLVVIVAIVKSLWLSQLISNNKSYSLYEFILMWGFRDSSLDFQWIWLLPGHSGWALDYWISLKKKKNWLTDWTLLSLRLCEINCVCACRDYKW